MTERGPVQSNPVPDKILRPIKSPTQTEALDGFLKDAIGAAYAACETGRAHLTDKDPKVVDEALTSVTEILTTIMDGNTEDWIG